MTKYALLTEVFNRHSAKNLAVTLVVVVAAGCTTPKTSTPMAESSLQPVTADTRPVLIVPEREFTFSMYPEYVDENKSKLKLGICDKQSNVVHAKNVVATLIAKDGHRSSAKFFEDQNIQKYVAVIPLKHHEDYVVETDLTLENVSAHFTPKFSFHCCDPIPAMDNPGGEAK